LEKLPQLATARRYSSWIIVITYDFSQSYKFARRLTTLRGEILFGGQGRGGDWSDKSDKKDRSDRKGGTLSLLLLSLLSPLITLKVLKALKALNAPSSRVLEKNFEF